MYSGDPTKEVPKVIHDSLMADPLAVRVDNRIYTHAPDNCPYPYIECSFEFKDGGSHTTAGFEGIIQFRVFSQQPGLEEADSISQDIFKLFERSELNINDLGTCFFYRFFKNIFRDPDEDKVWIGISRFRIKMGG